MDRSSDAPPLRPWHDGDVIAGRYEILEFLGAGGMGLVYRCRDRHTSRVRAIKTLRLDLPEDERALVLRLLQSEATALARVENDFVVRIHDACVDASVERPFVVMELLRGRDLEKVLQGGRPPKPQALAWLWQAACGLKAIHAEGIVHRDLKPANLFLNERDDGSIELKILDFSISRILDHAKGRTTVIVGTRGFMSPEQAAGYDVDHRADIFALGQVAQALLEADAPFNGWHRKATAADRRERFESATTAVEELAAVLGLVLPGRASLGPPDAILSSATTVVAPPSRRRSRSWLLTAGLLGAGLFVIPFAHWRARTEEGSVASAASATAAQQLSAVPAERVDSGPEPMSSTAASASAVPRASVEAKAQPPRRRPPSPLPPAKTSSQPQGTVFW